MHKKNAAALFFLVAAAAVHVAALLHLATPTNHKHMAALPEQSSYVGHLIARPPRVIILELVEILTLDAGTRSRTQEPCFGRKEPNAEGKHDLCTALACM